MSRSWWAVTPRSSPLAAEHDVADFTTDLDQALSDSSASIYFDAQVTSERKKSILKAIGAGKHIYTEKPIAESVEEGVELVTAAGEAGVINGVVHDKLYLPGLLKLKRLIDAGFFGRILSVRGEFGYWVFEGDLLPAQRPSWNYRAEDGGGMVLDMFPHWNYVLENLFGKVLAVTAKAVTHIPERWDEQAASTPPPPTTYAIFELEGDVIAQVNSSWAVRVDRGELVEFQVDGTHGSAPACSAAASRPCLSGTQISRRPRTSAASGSRSRTMRNSSTGSVPSGSSTCPTWMPADHMPTISPPAFAACSWSRRA